MSAFKAYDFRGVYEKDFSLHDIYKIGYYLPALLKAKKILVGRDMRISSPALFDALSKGITDSGNDVCNMGLTTTPMVYYFTAKHHFDASVMITASHNPKDQNGLKISAKDALPVGYDTGLGELEKIIMHNEPVPVEGKGKIIDYPVKEEYLLFQQKYRHDLSNLSVVMDCSNGMASILVKDIFGFQPHYLYDRLDGTFPHHEANPLDPANIKDLQHKVVAERADIGVIFDGDADRVMFVDETGTFIPPDIIIAVLAHYFIEEQQEKGYVIQDIRTSKSVTEYINDMGREVYTWRVGRAYAALKLREINGSFGGEFAGHYYFRDFFFSDSAMIASQIALYIFSKMKRKGISVSQLIRHIIKYANSGEINFKLNNKTEAMEAVKQFFTDREKPLKIMDFDGYRIEFKDWWFNVRLSNTEPFLRLIIEAKDKQMLTDKLNEAEKIIGQFK